MRKSQVHKALRLVEAQIERARNDPKLQKETAILIGFRDGLLFALGQASFLGLKA
jgi:hypothetical protein